MSLQLISCETAFECQQLAATQKTVVVQAITLTVGLVVLYYLFWFAVFGPRMD